MMWRCSGIRVGVDVFRSVSVGGRSSRQSGHVLRSFSSTLVAPGLHSTSLNINFEGVDMSLMWMRNRGAYSSTLHESIGGRFALLKSGGTLRDECADVQRMDALQHYTLSPLSHTVQQESIGDDLNEVSELELSSVKKKRRRKMNHHKHRKRLKRDRIKRQRA
mmetsp:Transcript_483/g.876  ORF Transcript_483/g.876 Transcript_483/m.876 type:complete len:163 (+) Transcript_483:76-564(+)